MLGMDTRQWTAFIMVYGFIIAFTWVIPFGKITLFYKLLFTIGGALATYFIVLSKVS